MAARGRRGGRGRGGGGGRGRGGGERVAVAPHVSVVLRAAPPAKIRLAKPAPSSRKALTATNSPKRSAAIATPTTARRAVLCERPALWRPDGPCLSGTAVRAAVVSHVTAAMGRRGVVAVSELIADMVDTWTSMWERWHLVALGGFCKNIYSYSLSTNTWSTNPNPLGYWPRSLLGAMDPHGMRVVCTGGGARGYSYEHMVTLSINASGVVAMASDLPLVKNGCEFTAGALIENQLVVLGGSGLGGGYGTPTTHALVQSTDGATSAGGAVGEASGYEWRLFVPLPIPRVKALTAVYRYETGMERCFVLCANGHYAIHYYDTPGDGKWHEGPYVYQMEYRSVYGLVAAPGHGLIIVRGQHGAAIKAPLELLPLPARTVDHSVMGAMEWRRMKWTMPFVEPMYPNYFFAAIDGTGGLWLIGDSALWWRPLAPFDDAGSQWQRISPLPEDCRVYFSALIASSP